MRSDSPWKWPLCTATALFLLLLGVWLTPRSWIAFLAGRPPAPVEALLRSPGAWLQLVPPPDIEVVPASHPDDKPPGRSPAPEFQDADWWLDGVRIRVGADGLMPTVERTSADRRDSIRTALDLLGVTPELLARVRPDSLLAARLRLLSVQEGFRFDELKPYLAALSRAEAYGDIMSRATDMFGDFLQHEISVTPRADSRQDSP